MENRFETFTQLLSSINRAIRKIKNEEIKKYDLKGPHVMCIYLLYKKGDLTSRELTELCDEDKASISRIIEHLEARGLIESDIDLKKRYRTPLRLTEGGRRIGEFVNNKTNEVLDAISLGVSDEERSTLYKTLGKINDNLANIVESYNE